MALSAVTTAGQQIDPPPRRRQRGGGGEHGAAAGTGAAARARTRRRLPASERRLRYLIKPAVFLACLGPLAWLIWLGFNGGLGANPIEATVRFLGDWGLRFLLISLAVTPAREVLSLPVLIRFRRMMGLFAFFYISLHLLGYIGLDQFFDWSAIWADVVKRTYITLGMGAFLLLVPLAVTSTKGMIKRLGAPRWKKLHMLVYPAAILGVGHFYMMVKADIREPLLYGAILAGLLGWRVAARAKQRRPRRPERSSTPGAGVRSSPSTFQIGSGPSSS